IVTSGRVVHGARVAVVRVKLDRFDVFDINGGLPASASCVSTDQDSELLVLKTDHLATNDTTVFKTDGVGEQRRGDRNQQQNGEQKSKCFLHDTSPIVGAFR